MGAQVQGNTAETEWAPDIVSGVLPLGGVPYAWDLPLLNPYVPLEQGVAAEPLRRWRLAVVRDLLRTRNLERDAVATARGWADVSWAKVHAHLAPDRKPQKTPGTATHATVALLLCALVLQQSAPPPGFLRGGPKRPTRGAPSPHLQAIARYQPMQAANIRDPVWGLAPPAPPLLDVSSYLQRYPDPDQPLPLPSADGLVAPWEGYAALWATPLAPERDKGA